MTAAGAAGVREGDVLAGKYRIERILGAGGMGVVIAARHLELDERVALKFLLPEVLEHPDAVARFAREARAVVKIKSEHVARVMDVGKLENGAPYTVMEYLEGSDLSAWLKERGALSVEQTVDFVLQACEALAEAHLLGIVHRDLKPSNLFVTRRRDGTPFVKVLDFGISKTTGAFGSGQSVQTTGIIGSPLYMAPEQMQSSRDVDVRCDVWALGVILYELVTGKPPFRAESMPELVLRVVQGGPPQPLRELRPSVPAELESVVGKCLARDRAQRFEHVAELARALGPFGSEKARFSVERIVGVLSGAGAASRSLPTPSSSPPPPPVPSSLSGDDVPGAARATADSWGKTARPVARSRRLALAALAAAGTFGFVAWRATRTAGKASLDSEPAVRAPADGAFAAFTPEPKPSAAVAVSSSAAASVAEVQSAPPSASGSTSSAPRPRAAIAAVATAARPVRAAHSRSSAGAEPASIFDDRK